MKSKFDSKLFKKQINLDSCNAIMGGMSSGCSHIAFSGPTGGTNASDSTTTHYDEDGNVKSVQHCDY